MAFGSYFGATMDGIAVYFLNMTIRILASQEQKMRPPPHCILPDNLKKRASLKLSGKMCQGV